MSFEQDFLPYLFPSTNLGRIEMLATVLGIIGVILRIRRNILCMPIGIVMVLLSSWIYYQYFLYSDMILHIIYAFLQGYGWYAWLHGGTNATPLPVRMLTVRMRWIIVGGGLLVTALWGSIMARFTNAVVPFGDAFTTVFALTAEWLIARKFFDNWMLWIIVDVVAAGIYIYQGLFYFAFLYVIFTMMAVWGMIEWRREVTA